MLNQHYPHRKVYKLYFFISYSVLVTYWMKLSCNTLYTTPIMFYSSLYLNVCTFSIFAAFYKVWIIQYIKTFEWVLSIDVFRNGLKEFLSTFIRFIVITIFVLQRINIDFEWLSDFVAVYNWITFYYKNISYEKYVLFLYWKTCIRIILSYNIIPLNFKNDLY